jgi:hypothetical protein
MMVIDDADKRHGRKCTDPTLSRLQINHIAIPQKLTHHFLPGAREIGVAHLSKHREQDDFACLCQVSSIKQV